MSKQDGLVTDREEIVKIIARAQVIHLGLHDGDDIYMLPMNYGYTWEEGQLTFYLHGALEGKKIDLLRKNPHVGFAVDCDHQLVEGEKPCQHSFRFASVIGNGEAELVEDPQEKMKGLKALMRQYSQREFEFYPRLVSIVAVIKITVRDFTGKVRG